MIKQLQSTLGLNPRTAAVSRIAAHVGRLSYADRVALLTLSRDALADGRGENLRIVGAKTLVALAPLSAGSIRVCLARSPASRSADCQFSLLCFLDELQDFPGGTDLAADVPPLLESLLMRTRRDPAKAAWMAADLLGDHWPINAGLPVLLRVATRARYSPGREAALHGLMEALKRANVRTRWRIVEVLKRVAATDTNRQVRGYAREMLGELVA